MSNQTISKGLPSVISSPVSEAGLTLCNKQDGLTTDQSGQGAVHASLSARQAKEKGLLTSGTYGPASSGSSASASLTSLLASKLQARTRLLGGTLFTLTWKERVTPAGFRIPALRATVRRISDKDFIGAHWASPRAADVSNEKWETKQSRNAVHLAMGKMKGVGGMTLPMMAEQAGWRSPNHTDGEGGVMEIRQGCAGKYKLRNEAPLTSWPTPQVFDGNGIPREPRYKGNAPSEQGNTRNPDMPGSYRMDLKDAAGLSGWSTPNQRDYKDSPNQIEVRKDGKSKLDVLSTQAMSLAGWTTPKMTDDNQNRRTNAALERSMSRDNAGSELVAQARMLVGPARLTASGQILTGSGAGIKSGGRLFPLFPCWLMGFPVLWDMIAQQIERKKA